MSWLFNHEWQTEYAAYFEREKLMAQANKQLTITISGPQGAGKSILLNEIVCLLMAHGIPRTASEEVVERPMSAQEWSAFKFKCKPDVKLVVKQS